MFHHILNNQISIPNPTFRLFDRMAPSGVDQLDPSLLINSITVTPTVRYKGGDADSSNWDHWSYGEILPVSAAGTLAFNQGSPCLGDNDDSVLGDGTNYFQSSANTLAEVTTEDIVIEVIFKAQDALERFAAKKDSGAAAGWYIGITGSGTGKLEAVINAAANVAVTSANLTVGAWYHVMVFLDRSGSGQIYVNGVASGSAVDISGQAASIAIAAPFTLGATSDNLVPLTTNIAYLAMWQQNAWLDTHLQATVAQDRFNRLIGLHPPKAEGTTVPTVQTRASVAYLDKLEDSNTTRKLYQVGDNWLRKVSRLDSNGDEIKGYLPETTATNLCLQSEDIGTTWIKVDAGDAVGGSVVTPNKSTSVTAGLIPDSTGGQHYIQQAVTLTAATYTFSVWAKKGSQDWIGLYQTPNTAGKYFDLANGVLGSNLGGAATESFIEDWGDGWYRCGISFTGTAASHTVRIYPAEADADVTFAGDGATVSTYLWGAQVELNEYISSYIPTTTGTVQRTEDELTYKGDDGNIGGVGSELRGSMACNILQPDFAENIQKNLISLSDNGSNSDRISLFYTGVDGKIRLNTLATGGNGGSVIGTDDHTDNIIHEVRAAWIVNNLQLFIDGIEETAADTTFDAPDDLDQIDVGMFMNDTAQLNGVLSSIKLFKVPTKQG